MLAKGTLLNFASCIHCVALCVLFRPNFRKYAKWNFTPGLEEGTDNKVNVLPLSSPHSHPLPNNPDGSYVTNVVNGRNLWFAKQMNQISTVVCVFAVCPSKSPRQLWPMLTHRTRESLPCPLPTETLMIMARSQLSCHLAAHL